MANHPAADKDKKEKIDGQYEEKIVKIARTTKVVKGGRNFGIAVLVVIGDRNGKFGIGRGKAKEVPDAIRKAIEAARRNIVEIPLSKGTLHHPVRAAFGASTVYMQPASEGTGIIAGGAMRAMLELAGVKDVLAKSYGSRNPDNVVRATLSALLAMSSPEQIAEKRGMTVHQLFNAGEAANV